MNAKWTLGLLSAVIFSACAGVGIAAESPAPMGNQAERLEWFQDQGFGLFVHWSIDSQLGVVISHSLVGASDDYKKMFFNELPKTFNPKKFDADAWAALAKWAGMRYVVFTTKHHSGFCMWDTKTTDYNIMRTPFKRDVVAETFNAFRAQGLAAGIYFSPDDFWWMDRSGMDIHRNAKMPSIQPTSNPGLMNLNLAQMREILTGYGRVDVAFFDGQPDQLRELVWQIQPHAIVTRGALSTPEKTIPGQSADAPWEACLTMGHGWGYQPFDDYKSPGRLITDLIEIRAKGGNLLLNVGPKADGELPIEQEERLREMGLWMAVNGEAIYGVRPWVVAGEPNVWFTRKKKTDTVYAFLVHKSNWVRGEVKDFILKNVSATDATEISVLGQNDRVLEYQSRVPKTTWQQMPDGLHVRVTLAQRVRDNSVWTHPVVLKITHASASAAKDLAVRTSSGSFASPTSALLKGHVEKAGPDDKVGFEYRDITGMDAEERTSAWLRTPLVALSAEGDFALTVEGLQPGHAYEFRAVMKAPAADLPVYGREMQFRSR